MIAKKKHTERLLLGMFIMVMTASCTADKNPVPKKVPRKATVHILLVDSGGKVVDKRPGHTLAYDQEGKLTAKTTEYSDGYTRQLYQEGKQYAQYKVSQGDTLHAQEIRFDSLQNPLERYIKTSTYLNESTKKTTLQRYTYKHTYNGEGKVLGTIGQGRFQLYYNDSLATDSIYQLIKKNHYENGLLLYEYVARNGQDTVYEAHYRYNRHDSLILAAKDMGDMYVETGFERAEGEKTRRTFTEDRKTGKLIETAQTDFYDKQGRRERSVRGRKLGDKWHKVRHYYSYNEHGLLERERVKDPVSRYTKVKAYAYEYWGEGIKPVFKMAITGNALRFRK